MLEYLNIRCAIPAHDLEQIPEYGPLVIIANHPTGTLDGLALLYAVSRVRRDVKVVTNRMLTHLEPLSSLFIPVDNIHGRTAKAALQQMDQQLQAGGVLIFFPAGAVSRLTRRGIRDKKWHSGFIKLAAKYRAPLLPAWINARNSALFYASTLVSDNLPLLLLMQQMFRRRNSSLPVRIGQQIPWSSWFDAQSSARELTGRCYQHLEQLRKGLPGRFKTESAIARPEDRALLKRELHKAECLGRTADGKVIYLWQRNGQEDAPLLRELGRLREIAFRAVGEGSGKRRDIDGYDDDYLHLILWDEEDLEIVGAYRFIPTAIQLAKRGLGGDSTVTVWLHYDGRMDDVLQHGIELGRSFIQPRYWGVAGWTTCGPASALHSALSGTIAICLSGVDFWRIAARRPRSAAAFYRMWRFRRRIRWRSRVALIRGVAARRWRSLAGRITTTIRPAEVPARQSRLRDPPLYGRSTRKCASRAACSLSISAAIRIK